MAKKGLPPDTPAPKSAIYDELGPRGGKTGEQADSTRGKPLPPTQKPGHTWEIAEVDHHKEVAHHKGKK